MNRIVFVLGFCLFVMALSVARAGDSGKQNTLNEAEKKLGWKLLFDGKTVDGWMSWNSRKPLKEGKWRVKEGVLELTRGGGDIYTAKPYENFILSLEWKTTGNSGIFVRVDPKSKGPIWRVAPEMQIERRNAAYLYNLYYPKGKLKINTGDWNHVKIRMVNGHGTHWFNGVKLYEYKIGSEDWNKRVMKSKFNKQIKEFGMKANGHIGLQDHGATVRFRNIKIRELPKSVSGKE
ncbi:MAG: DUF1080 domain-containing protein [Gemmataceae bacterium]